MNLLILKSAMFVVFLLLDAVLCQHLHDLLIKRANDAYGYKPFVWEELRKKEKNIKTFVAFLFFYLLTNFILFLTTLN